MVQCGGSMRAMTFGFFFSFAYFPCLLAEGTG
jgi:hypothetical protein